jgi:hypothetical protein
MRTHKRRTALQVNPGPARRDHDHDLLAHVHARIIRALIEDLGCAQRVL